MWEHENVLFRKDAGAQLLKLFTASVGAILLSLLTEDYWAANPTPWIGALLCLTTILDSIAKIRKLPELIELRAADLWVQKTRQEHYRIPLKAVRVVEIAGTAVRFVLKDKEAKELGLDVPENATDPVLPQLLGLDCSLAPPGERVIEVNLSIPGEAVDTLVSRLVEKFDFALWADQGDRVIYWPKKELPTEEARAGMSNLVCAVCGQQRPSKYWFQDDWGRPVPKCTDCQKAKRIA